MKSLLTDAQMQQYKEQWQSAQDYKQSIIDGRWDLESYTAKLKIADAIWTRYEDTIAANQKAETEYAAQSAYESALEHLEELLDANPALEMYLDRNVRFDAGNECAPSVGEVPRYKLSQSHYAISPQFQSKREIKLNVIEDAVKLLLQDKEKTRTESTPDDSE